MSSSLSASPFKERKAFRVNSSIGISGAPAGGIMKPVASPPQWMEEVKQQMALCDEDLQWITEFLLKNKLVIDPQVLGRGGNGIVVKGVDREKTRVAIKILKCANEDHLNNIIREFNNMSKCSSKHIVRPKNLLHLRTPHNIFQFLVMERCQMDLKKFMKDKEARNTWMSRKQVYEICVQLVVGLADLHANNILHLDIKPANVLFGFDFKWKFTDLGVSKNLDHLYDHTVNLTGITAKYASPEQYQLYQFESKKKITRQSDIYSLGVLFLEMTGVNVRDKWVIKQKLRAKDFSKYLNPEFKAFNEFVLINMLQYQPTSRASLEQIYAILVNLINNEAAMLADVMKQQQQQQQQLDQNQQHFQQSDSLPSTSSQISSSASSSSLNSLQSIGIAKESGSPILVATAASVAAAAASSAHKSTAAVATPTASSTIGMQQQQQQQQQQPPVPSSRRSESQGKEVYESTRGDQVQNSRILIKRASLGMLSPSQHTFKLQQDQMQEERVPQSAQPSLLIKRKTLMPQSQQQQPSLQLSNQNSNPQQMKSCVDLQSGIIESSPLILRRQLKTQTQVNAASSSSSNSMINNNSHSSLNITPLMLSSSSSSQSGGKSYLSPNGLNPHQSSAMLRSVESLGNFSPLKGKELFGNGSSGFQLEIKSLSQFSNDADEPQLYQQQQQSPVQQMHQQTLTSFQQQQLQLHQQQQLQQQLQNKSIFLRKQSMETIREAKNNMPHVLRSNNPSPVIAKKRASAAISLHQNSMNPIDKIGLSKMQSRAILQRSVQPLHQKFNIVQSTNTMLQISQRVPI